MFKINYKGTSCRGTTYDYLCARCNHIQQEVHAAAEEPVITCAECSYSMHKKPGAPAFDADHHDSMKSHNLGWDGDEKA